MRTLRLIALAAALSPLAGFAQSPDQLYTATQQQLDVAKALLAQQAAWNHGNLESYLNFYKDAPDTQAVLAGPVRGMQSIRNAYSINFPRAETMGTLDESEVDVRALGSDHALATGHYHLTRTKKGGGDADGSFVDIFEKTPTGWKIIFSETT